MMQLRATWLWIAAIALGALTAHGATPVGVRVTDTIVPSSSDDTYPTHEAQYGKGGLRTVAAFTDLAAIPSARREEGMMVYCTDNRLFYQLAPDLTNWIASGTVNVRAFGAKGDAVHDDTEAIQAAMDAAGSQRVVFIPAGVYRLTAMLEIRHDYQQMVGDWYNSELRIDHNGNGIGWDGVLEKGERRYYPKIQNLRITTTASVLPENALHLVDVCYGRFKDIFVTGGAGPGFNRAVYMYGNYTPGVIDGGVWGNTFQDCDMYTRPGADWTFYGAGGPSSTAGPNNLRVLSCYINGGLGGASTNGSVGGIFLENCNMIRIVLSDVEGYHTNAVRFGTNVQSTSVAFTRTEVVGGQSSDREMIRYEDGEGPGHMILANHMWMQGAGGSRVRIAGPDYSKRIPATILDPSFEGPNQVLANHLLVGMQLDYDIDTYAPVSTAKLSVMSTNLNTTNLLGAMILDGVVNPRVYFGVEGTNGAVIKSTTTAESAPLRIRGSDSSGPMAVHTILGTGILQEPAPGTALSVSGDVVAGNGASLNPFIEGWTAINDGVYVRSTNYTDRPGFLAMVRDGTTNRGVEFSVKLDRVVIKDRFSTGASRIDFEAGNQNVFTLSDSAVTIQTNTIVASGAKVGWSGGAQLQAGTAGGTNAILVIWPNGTTNVLALQP